MRGAKRLTLAMEARSQEAKGAVVRDENGELRVRREKREWSLGKKGAEGTAGMVPEKSEGKPWPRHLDPETVLEPLKGEASAPAKAKDPEAPSLKSRRLSADDIKNLANAEGEEAQESREEENPLRIILDIRNRRSRRRRARAMERMEKLSKEMEIEMEGPEPPETPR